MPMEAQVGSHAAPGASVVAVAFAASVDATGVAASE